MTGIAQQKLRYRFTSTSSQLSFLPFQMFVVTLAFSRYFNHFQQTFTELVSGVGNLKDTVIILLRIFSPSPLALLR